MNLSFVFYSLLVLFLFVYFGIGLSFFLIPKKLEKYAIFFSPFLGLSYLSLCTWWGIHFIPGGIEAIVLPITIPPAILLIAAFFFRKEKVSSVKWLMERDSLCLITICSVLFLLLSIPNLFLLNDFNVLVIGNNDIIHYATISEFLTRSSLVQPLPGVSQLSYFIENNNFGAYISTAVPAVVLGLQTYTLENCILNLFFIFSLPIFYLISIELFTFKSWIALIVTALIGINFHFIYILYTGFLGQVIGCGLFYTLSLLCLYPFFSSVDTPDLKPYVPACMLLMFGMISTYSPLLPIFFGMMGVFITVNTVIEQSLKKTIAFGKFLFITTLLTIIIAPGLCIQRIRLLITYSQGKAGWPMLPISPEQILGVVGNDVGWLPIANAPWTSTPNLLIARIVISAIFVLIMVLSLWTLLKNNKQLFSFSFAFLTIIFLLYAYLELIEFGPAVFGGKEYVFSGAGYMAYKILTYGLPLIIIIFFVFFNSVNYHIFNFKQKASAVILILLIIGNIWSFSAMIHMTFHKSYPIKDSILNLQTLNNMKDISSINIEEDSFSDQMWIYYFLFLDKDIYLKHSTYFTKSPQIGEWTLVNNNRRDLSQLDNTTIIPINSEYFLIKPSS